MPGTAQLFPVVGSSLSVPNPLPVVGTLSNDAAAPSSNNVGVLPALASASAQAYTNGEQVLLSEDLSGNLRVVIENGATGTNNLLTAGNFAILAGSAITGSAGAGSVVTGGNIGIAPNNATSVTNFPPSTLTAPGVFDYDNAVAIQAKLDLVAAIASYSGLTFTSLSGSSANLSVLGNGSSASTYIAGNYSAGTSMDIPTSITLDAQGNPNAVFVFKAGSTLTLESGASVILANGAQAANVFWVVGSSFTSIWNGIISNMVGTILASTSITLGGGTLIGRALANTGAVTMSTTETITVPTAASSGPAVPVVFSGIANVNVVEWAGLTLAPPTNFGTAPSGLVIGGNVSLFAGYTALVTDASGNLKVDIAAGSVTTVISGSVTVGNFPAIQPVSFAGSVTVGNFPATQPVSGTITALQGTSPWVVSGSVTALPSGIQPISGSVAVTNFPASQLIAGSVAVSNFPALQNTNITEWNGLVLGSPTVFGTAPTGLVIGGNVELFAGPTALATDASGNLKVDVAAGSLTASISGSVTVGNFPVIQPISGSVTALISGSVTVGNFPTIQPISGSVAVTNFPAIQAIAGSVTALISGSVTVGNFPALQNVDVTEWDGIVLGAPTTWGTAPTGNIVIGGNVELFAGNTSLVADGSSNLKVNVAAGSVNALVSGSVAVTNFPATQVVTGNLTNNNAAPTATLQGVMGHIAETAYATVTYSTGDVVLATTDLHGATNIDVQALDSTALGAPTTWGTPPTGNIVIGGNVELFAGNTALVADGASNLKVNIAAGSVAALQGTSPWVVAGALTNNNAAPVATLVGVLPAIAETAYATVTYATGDMVLPVTDLHGALNTDLQAVAGTAVVAASAGVQKVGISGATGATLDAVITAATAPTDGVATLVVYNSTPPSLTTGQSVATQGDYVGSQFVKPYRRSQTVAQATTIAASTTKTTVLAAQAAGVFADISTLIMTVVPGATVDTAFTAILTDGTNNYTISMDTGALGTAVGVPAPINITFNPPLPATTAATVWSVTLSSSTPTVYINIVAVLQKAS